MNKLNNNHLNQNVFKRATVDKSLINFNEETKNAAVQGTFIKFFVKLY